MCGWTSREFRRLLAACRAHGHAEADVCPACLQPLAEAAALYRGDFLAGFTLRDSPDFDDWQFFEAESLRRELGAALERLVRGASAREEFAAAAGYARRWLALDPLHEPAHCALMSSYAWAGQRPAALRQYGECARLMERELGAPPQAATTQLYEAIKRNTLPPLPGLSQPPTPPRGEPSLRLSPPSRRRPADAHAPQSFSLLDRIVRGQLVGREREVVQIRDLWQRAAAGEGHVLLVSGEAGIGKTRLAREAAAIAGGSEARVLIGRCEAASAAPYAPVAQLVRAALDDAGDTMRTLPDYLLADLLMLAPQLRPRYPHIRPNPPLDPPLERQRLFDSFVSWCELLAGDGRASSDRPPLLLWVEDAHWADSGTLSLLRYLAPRIGNLRLLLVITYRDGGAELAEARGLREMLLDLNRERLAEPLRLARLSRDATADLLATMLATGGEISPEFLDSVYRETEGNPFFVEEVCKTLIEEGKLYFAGGTWRRSDIRTVLIPQSIRAAILSRIEKLPDAIQEMLRSAAILGQEFDLAALQAMGAWGSSERSEWDEETLLDMLEHVVRTQLVAEIQRTAPIRYAFAHALIPFTLRESLSGLRLQRLHGRAASAIEALRPDDFEALAHHFTAAGERGKAFDYCRRAAQRAEDLYAYDTAVQYLHAALSLLDESAAVETRIAALEQLADVHHLRAERAEAIQTYAEALELWRSQAGPLRGRRRSPAGGDRWIGVRLCRKIDETFLLLTSGADMQRFEMASRTSLETGLALIADAPPHPEAVRLLATLANDAHGLRLRPDWEAAERYARAAVTMAEQLNAPVELAAALGALDTVYGVRGLLRERVALAQRCVALSRDPRFGSRREQCRLLCAAGNALMLVGEYGPALSYLLEAETLADQIRDVSRQVHALGLQAQCFFGLDRWDEMLQIEDKRRALEERYGHDRVGVMCFYCGLSANVMALRGDFEGRGRLS